MTIFSAGRSEGFPSQYGDNRTPVTVDVLETGLITAFTILVLTLIVTVLGFSGTKCGWAVLRTFLSLFIGAIIMVANFGQEWEVAKAHSTSHYRAGCAEQLDMTLGIKIGLRSVNVTLERTEPPANGTLLEHETIKYNERFYWTWDQGRFGFGPYAGLLQRSFREAQRRGLPLPILWAMEYFVVDGEGFRFGRFYRTAGWYTHILIWSAFATWVLVNIFLRKSGLLAAKTLRFTGGLQLLACIVWAAVRNPNPLIILFGDEQLQMTYGSSFWITIFNGILCLLLSAVLHVMDLLFPSLVSEILGLDPLDGYMEVICKSSEVESVITGDQRNSYMELRAEIGGNSRKDYHVSVMRRRSSSGGARKLSYKAPHPIEITPVEPPQQSYVLPEDQSLPEAEEPGEDIYMDAATRNSYLEMIPNARMQNSILDPIEEATDDSATKPGDRTTYVEAGTYLPFNNGDQSENSHTYENFETIEKFQKDSNSFE